MVWALRLASLVSDAIPAFWELVPERHRKDVEARLADLNPFAGIAANEDLLRALRLAWIEAALMVNREAMEVARQNTSAPGRDDAERFGKLVRTTLKRIRGQTFNRDEPLAPSPIDAGVQTVLVGVPRYVRERHPDEGAALTRSFAPTLAALVGWPAEEVPGLFGDIARRGLAHGSGGQSRDFGELAFAAFAEIIKHPDQHPEATQAFQLAQTAMSRELTLQVMGTLQGLDARVDQLLASLPELPFASIEAFGQQLVSLQALLHQLDQKMDGVGDKLHSVDRKVDALHDLLSEHAAEPAFLWPVPQDFTDFLAEKRARFSGRQALAVQLEQWRCHDSRRVVLLLAPFGVGKSAFMAQWLHQLQIQGAVTVSHFCRFDEQDTLEPGRIVQSLAGQFAQHLPDYRAAVERDREAQRCLMNAEADPRAAWSRGVVDALRTLPEPDRPVLILIDGLDESLELHRSTGNHQGSLLDLVLSAASGRLPTWLKVAISSRQVDLLGSRRQAIHQIDMLGDNARDNDSDLASYIQARLAHPALAPLLADSGLPADEVTRRLLALCDGKFLLAHYLFQDADAGDLDAAVLQRLFQQRGALSGMDAFYADVFERRVSRAALDTTAAVAVLGLIAVALQPLTAEAIAAVLAPLSVQRHDVQRTVEAFSGLLAHDNTGGITFDHFSIEQWLDPSRPEGLHNGRPKAGRFAIDRAASVLRLQAHCARLATQAQPLAHAGACTHYLERHGIVHLLDAGALASALSLLVALIDGASRHPRLRESRVIQAIDEQLQRFDRGDSAAASVLTGLTPPLLARLLATRDYETGKFRPIIRTLVQFHPDHWPAIQARLLQVGEKDLVLCDDIGVATAQAWHSAQGASRSRLMSDIEAMAASEDDDHREIAAYALKHLCQRTDPTPWWHPVADTVRRLVNRYASSAHPIDRMVAGEILLALAVQGELVTDGWIEAPNFWRPHWPNLACDVAAIQVTLAAEQGLPWPAPTQATCPALAVELPAAIVQFQLAEALGDRLLAHPLLNDADHPLSLQRLYALLLSQAEQQSDANALDEVFDRLERLVDDPGQRGFVLELVQRLMLHPLWDMTEAAANLVSDLIQRQAPRGNRWWLIDELLQAEPALWRLRFGAVDAAFTAGAVQGYEHFRQALLAVGRDPHCRVRGICVDDLRGWVKAAGVAGRRAILGDPEIVALVQLWLSEADDMWLLEYLHLLLNETSCGKVPDRALVRRLMPATLSPWLQFDGPQPFHLLERDRFLADMEARRSRA